MVVSAPACSAPYPRLPRRLPTASPLSAPAGQRGSFSPAPPTRRRFPPSAWRGNGVNRRDLGKGIRDPGRRALPSIVFIFPDIVQSSKVRGIFAASNKRQTSCCLKHSLCQLADDRNSWREFNAL